MAENVQVSYYDLNAMRSAMSALQAQTAQIGSNLVTVNNNVVLVDKKIAVANQELATLKRQFVQMMREQRMSAALQRALTEIIRIRQELEQKFGNHKLARDTMLGILQANDLQLVSKETFARCSEELMISTPRYWLAPCVVALTAWIGNNEDLANRAVEEGIRRDPEKTTLLFALICRRVAKGFYDSSKPSDRQKGDKAQKACTEWLNQYFHLLQAKDMKRSVIALLDAYYNGVFGQDENTCSDSIANWISELEEQQGYHATQVDHWVGFFRAYCESAKEKFPTLAEVCATDFENIDAYLQRVLAVRKIHLTFQTIINEKVDRKELMEAIDEQLVKLVSEYDEEERSLREEEERMQFIKELKGDEERADRILAFLHGKDNDEQVDFVECLTNEIFDIKDIVLPNDPNDPKAAESRRNSKASVRKCAIAILSNYIVEGYRKFITEMAGNFPTKITLKLDGWTDSTEVAEASKLHASYEKYVNNAREKELANVKTTKKTAFIVGAALLAVLAIIFVIAIKGAGGIVLMLAFGAAAIFCVVKFFKEKKNIELMIAQINQKHDQWLSHGKAVISKAIGEWAEILTIVSTFRQMEATNDAAKCVVPMIEEARNYVAK